jgi:hypothetical protein
MAGGDGRVLRRARRAPVTHRSPLARLRFALERVVLRGLHYRLLLAALIIVGVAVLAGAVAVVLGGGFSGPAEAVWWAFLRLTDPGYLGDDQGAVRRTVSTIVTILGYVLFLGLLIAILTQWMNETIARLESGVTPAILSGHVVVFGWTQQTPAIVEALLRSRGRLERFLAGHRARTLRTVILDEQASAARLQELRERLGPVWDPRRVLIRAGTPLRVDHLERVAFRDAAVVILPGAGFAERNPQHIDARTIKTLASVSRFARESGTSPPLAVAEIFDARQVAVAEQAYDGESRIIAADGMVSRLIAQSVRHRGLWSVLSELFTLNEGNAIYVRRVPGQAGTAFAALRGRFPRAVLLGLVRPGERQPMLNPDPDTAVEGDDRLVFLARRFDDCVPGAEAPIEATDAPARVPLRPPAGGPRRLLILGWSHKVPALVRELARFGDDAFAIDVVSRTSLDEREAGFARSGSRDGSAAVRQIQASFSVPGVLADLQPETYDEIIVLASEALATRADADAISVVAALTLRNLFAGRPACPDVLIELLEPENEYLFRGGAEDVMVSPLVVSYLVSQVALRGELASVFWELTRPWGAQILLRPADAYLGADAALRFADVQRIAAAHGEIALGMRRCPAAGGGLALNPDRDAAWSVEPGDEAVVLTTINEQAS